MFKFSSTFILAALFLSLTTDLTEAEGQRVNAIEDWSVFVGQNPRECWAATTWKKTEWTGNKIQRDEVLLIIFVRPNENKREQVAYTGGTSLAEKSVNLRIGRNNYPFGAQGDWAWPIDKRIDGAIIDAMMSGSEAVITSRSRGGTAFTDTFSLSGSAAAIQEARSRCSRN